MKIPIKVYTTCTDETAYTLAQAYIDGKHLENVGGQLYLVEVINE